MLRLLKADGYEPLVHDCSYLGFPSCHIVVPGFSPLIHFDGSEVRLRRTNFRVRASAEHFPDLTDEEADRILRLIRFRGRNFDFSLAGLLFDASFRNVHDYSNERIGAYFALRQGEYKLAAKYFSQMIATGRYADDPDYIMCMKDYAVMRSEGLTHDQAAAVLRSTRRPKAADRTISDTSDLAAAIARYLPKPPCPDCSSCRYRDNGCEYEARRDIYMKITNAMQKENASQEALLTHLKELWA
jgi:ribosomal protein S12 methylthiotransferase accessory factor